MRKNPWTSAALAVGTFLFLFAWAWNLYVPLPAIHAVRQADTLFSAWSYCTEGAEFLRPRVAHRGLGTGVNIGEFPLASEVFSWPCQVSGHWSEPPLKVVILTVLVLNTLLWGFLLRRRLGEKYWPGWIWFTLIWVFSTHHLLHFTIALPDALALALVAFAGLLFSARRLWFLARLAAVASFTVAFGMRPYFIPLLLVASPSWFWMFATVAACTVFYFAWFKSWILQSEFVYYATDLTPFWRVPASEWTKILRSYLEIFVRDAANFVGLFWFMQGRRERISWRWGFGLFASSALVLLLRAPMIVAHHYYLGAAVVYFLIILIAGVNGFQRRYPRATAVLAWLYLVVAIANVQHHWHGGSLVRAHEVEEALAQAGVGPHDRIAVYMGEGSAPTPYLYFAKHVGWAFYGSAFQGTDHCPQGADWVMIERDERIVIERCQQGPPASL